MFSLLFLSFIGGFFSLLQAKTALSRLRQQHNANKKVITNENASTTTDIHINFTGSILKYFYSYSCSGSGIK